MSDKSPRRTRLLTLALPCLVLLPALGCAAGADPEVAHDGYVYEEDPGKEDLAQRDVNTISRVSTAGQVARFRGVQTGAYQVHNIDVGTGLAVLVRGSSFNLLFDGGSGDDKAGISADGTHNGNRLVAYLFAALGPSGPAACAPDGETYARVDRPLLTIDHLVVSHSHEDHVSLLADVLRCYQVRHVWEPGAVATTATYNKLIRAIGDRGAAVTYHTAARPPADKMVRFIVGGIEKFPPVAIASWVQFKEYAADGFVQRLNGVGTARFRILHADGVVHSDANENSMVLRVDLGWTSLLLVGDAESGPRLSPDAEPGDVEEMLLDRYASLIDVDILQAGHHGSKTSNRDAFVRQVSPSVILVGAGPRNYSGTVLPDAEVMDELVSLLPPEADANDDLMEQPADEIAGADTVEGTPVAARPRHQFLLRTDQSERYEFHDKRGELVPTYMSSGCAGDRIGVDGAQPGGCDSYVVSIRR